MAFFSFVAGVMMGLPKTAAWGLCINANGYLLHSEGTLRFQNAEDIKKEVDNGCVQSWKRATSDENVLIPRHLHEALKKKWQAAQDELGAIKRQLQGQSAQGVLPTSSCCCPPCRSQRAAQAEQRPQQKQPYRMCGRNCLQGNLECTRKVFCLQGCVRQKCRITS